MRRGRHAQPHALHAQILGTGVILGDALEADLSGATAIFMNNVLFDASLNAAFRARLARKNCPRLRVVACGAPLADPGLAHPVYLCVPA